MHSENFFAEGGAALSLLHEARGHYDVSLHGVGLALGSAAGIDAWHLDKLAALAKAKAMMSDPTISIAAIANLLGVSRSTLYAAIPTRRTTAQ